tara:strand:- start:5963 stop:6460 length:498 start_codon:yes stop_codon:yes gene_type:complete
MDSETLTWLFIVGGIILMILETVLPSGVALFLGFSGLTVGIIRWLGFLSNPLSAIFVWLTLTVTLTILIRPFIRKYLKGERSFKFADEDYEAIDQIVDVVETVNDTDNSGRIRFQGISWQARTIDGTLEPGTKARISYRENTTWIVEKADSDSETLFDRNRDKTS